jgi:hypothetical protein
MSDDFDRRVRALHESPFTLASIRIRARALRRRRRLAAVVCLLALGLGVAPVGVLVLSLHGPTQLPERLSAERRTTRSQETSPEAPSVPSACGSSTDRQAIAVEADVVGYASPRSAVRTHQVEGALIELSKSSEDAQVLAITPRGETTTLFAVSLLANGWMITGEIRC